MREECIMTEINEGKSNIDMESMKDLARKTGLSYNEAKEWIAEKTGGKYTRKYSDTDIEAVKRQNEQSEQNRKN